MAQSFDRPKQEESPQLTIEHVEDITAFRKAMSELWFKNTDAKKIKEELVERENGRISKLLAVDYTNTALLARQRLNEIETKSGAPQKFDRLIIASTNQVKSQFIREAINDQGIEITNVSKEDSLDETEAGAHQTLHRLIQEEEEVKTSGIPGTPSLAEHTPGFYSLDVARSKLTAIAKKYEDRPIIACDVVVLAGNSILEKPKSIEEARETLIALSGKTVTVSIGMTMLIHTSIGGVAMNERADIAITLKHFSEKDVDTYLTAAKENIVNVAGGIDYSNEAARMLVDENTPPSIERKGDQTDKKINFPADLLTEIKDYLFGVPMELTRELAREGKILAEQL